MSSSTRIDAVRRAWIAQAALDLARSPSPDRAIALGRAEWMCGEYESALSRFQLACTLDPRRDDAHIALIRAASMLAMLDLEEEALGRALQLHPMSPDIRLHAALFHVPTDLDAARCLLLPLAHLPLANDFLQAILRITSRSDQPLEIDPSEPDARRIARLQSLQWSLAHAHSQQVFVGLPSRVLLRALEEACSEGLTIECGVFHGRSLRIIAARTTGNVHGFDSFQGLPEAWSAHEPVGSYSTAGRLPTVPPHVTLHPGWFDDTLPAFFKGREEPIRLLHVDCDLFSSTRAVLDHAGRLLQPGSILVFDDFLGYPGFEQHEFRAFVEFTARTGLRWELLAASLLGREVAIRVLSSPA